MKKKFAAVFMGTPPAGITDMLVVQAHSHNIGQILSNIAQTRPEIDSIALVEAKRGYTPQEIEHACTLTQNTGKVIIARRKRIDQPGMKIGQRITSKLFSVYHKTGNYDLLSGLVVIPTDCLPLINISHVHEMVACTDLFTETVHANIPSEQILLDPDSTPDSIWRYPQLFINIIKTFILFAASSLSCTAVDYITFTLLYTYLLETSTASYFFARIISSNMNFMINRKFVFKHNGRTRKELMLSMVKYYTVVLSVLIIAQASMFFFADTMGLNAYITKVITDSTLFFVNYTLQKKIVFKPKG